MTAEVAVALAACVAAGLALVVAALVWRRTARLAAAQAVVLGSDTGDLLEFAVSLQARIDDLHRAVDEVAAGLSRVDRRVDGSVTNTAVVRYDAFGDMGGHLSWSMALLDDGGNGVVLTSIHGRSDARTYAKNVADWSCEQQLSPEEEEAIKFARSAA